MICATRRRHERTPAVTVDRAMHSFPLCDYRTDALARPARRRRGRFATRVRRERKRGTRSASPPEIPTCSATNTVVTDPMTDMTPFSPQKNGGAGSEPRPVLCSPRGNGMPMTNPSGATSAIAMATRAPPAAGAGAGRAAAARWLRRRQRGDDETGAARRNERAERAAESAGREQREQQNRQREDRMAEQQRQVLQQREFDADESEAEAREIHDRRRIGRERLLPSACRTAANNASRTTFGASSHSNSRRAMGVGMPHGRSIAK